MIEAKRAAVVIKFTSTLNHTARGSDLQTLTIHSFAHYVFGARHGSLVMPSENKLLVGAGWCWLVLANLELCSNILATQYSIL